jgi:ketosteroid isomerase-like protein
MIISLLAIAACGDAGDKAGAPSDEPPPVAVDPAVPAEPVPPPLTADEKLARFDACRNAALSGDEAALASCYRDDSVLKLTALPPSAAGAPALPLARQLRDAFSDLSMEPQLVLLSGDSIAAVLLVTGTHTGELWDIPATGKPISLLTAQVVELAPDGALRRDHTYLDQTALLHQLGVGKHATAPAAEQAWPTREPIVGPTGDVPPNFLAFNDGFYAALQARDFKAIGEAYASDAILRDLTRASTSRGTRAITEHYRRLLATTPDLSTSMLSQWGAGDWIVAETLIQGKDRGAKSEPWSRAQLDLIRYHEGKIIEHWTF